MSAPTMSRPATGGGIPRAMAGPRANGNTRNKAVCPSYLGASVGRLTRLDACGRPVEGPESVVTFDGAVTLTFEPEVQEGEALDTRNMAGSLCVAASTPDVLSGINVSIEFCAIDPAALQIMNPTWKLVRNAQGVITGFRIGEEFSDQYGFALEIWPKVAGGGAGACDDTDDDEEDPNDPSSLSGYFLLPWVNGRAPEEWEMTGDELMTFTVAGRTRGGSPWGTGPYLVTRDEMGAPSPLLMPIENGLGSSGYRHPVTNRPVTDPDHFHDDVVTVLPPAPGCGAHPLRRPDVDVTCGDQGVTVVVTNLDEISDPEDTDQQGRRPSVWVTWGDGTPRQDIANPADQNGNPLPAGEITHQYASPTEHKITIEASNGGHRIVRADPSATLEITPADTSTVEAGQAVQLQAVQTPGGGGDPTTVTGEAEWTSSDPAIATVGNTGVSRRGRVRGIKPGTVTITAKYGCHTVERSITVVGPVQSITLDGPAEVTEGESITLKATAHRQGGDTEDMTASAEWSSSSSAVATVDNGQNKGSVTGVKAGKTTIRARVQTPSGQRAGEKQVTVTAPVVTDSVSVSGGGTVTAGQTTPLTAEATMSDGTTKDVTGSATWASSDTAIATVSGGTVTGVAAGTAQITAASGGKTSPNHAVEVTAAGPTVQSLAAEPATASLNVDQTQQVTATATMSDSSTQDVTADATWESDNPGVATVGTGQNAGLITGVADGTTTVTATYGGRTAQVSVTVPAAQAAGRKTTRS